VLRRHGSCGAPSKLHNIVRHDIIDEDDQEAAVAAPGKLAYTCGRKGAVSHACFLSQSERGWCAHDLHY